MVQELSKLHHHEWIYPVGNIVITVEHPADFSWLRQLVGEGAITYSVCSCQGPWQCGTLQKIGHFWHSSFFLLTHQLHAPGTEKQLTQRAFLSHLCTMGKVSCWTWCWQHPNSHSVGCCITHQCCDTWSKKCFFLSSLILQCSITCRCYWVERKLVCTSHYGSGRSYGAVLNIGLLFIYSVETHFLATFTPILGSLVCYSRCTRAKICYPSKWWFWSTRGPCEGSSWCCTWPKLASVYLEDTVDNLFIFFFCFSCPCWTLWPYSHY